MYNYNQVCVWILQEFHVTKELKRKSKCTQIVKVFEGVLKRGIKICESMFIEIELNMFSIECTFIQLILMIIVLIELTVLLIAYNNHWLILYVHVPMNMCEKYYLAVPTIKELIFSCLSEHIFS